MQFTGEEKQIIGFYCITDRTALIQELSFIIPHIEDEDMKETAQSTLNKLEQITDVEFDRMDFTAYDDTEDFENE